MSRAIGIDLGTTNSCVAVVEQGDPLVIPNDEGSRTTPSVVAITDDGSRLIGQIARRQAVINPARTLYAVKRLIGRRFDDEHVSQTLDLSPYEIVEAENGDAWVQVDDQTFSPPQVSAMVLEKNEIHRRGLHGRRRAPGHCDRPSLFRRLSTTSDQGCRSNRGTRDSSNHQ